MCREMSRLMERYPVPDLFRRRARVSGREAFDRVYHEIKGEAIYAFVTLKPDQSPSDVIRAELMQQVRRLIGPIATPERIQWAEALPKTRSGKIMRRLLRNISTGKLSEMGDISTLLDADVVQRLIQGAKDFEDQPSSGS